MKTKQTQIKEECLLKLWFSKKYVNSSCLDEAIDWSQHQKTLNLEEISEYIAWRNEYLKTIEYLYELTSNYKIYYSCRPWSAWQDNKEVKVLKKENK